MSNNDPLTGAEQRITAVINTILDDIANQIATELDNATEIVAARFSLTRIAAMWARHVGRLIRALLDVAETAAQETSRDLNAPLPDDWHNLPGRYDTNTLPASLTGYVTDTERLIHTIGDRLTQAAIHTLAEGVAAGETLPQLRHRLRTLFAHDGIQLGPERADRIAATEACRAWNTATLAAARDMSGPDRFIVKQWLTRMDSHVREAHRRANGQIRLLDEPFSVGGVLMQAPGAPEAPPELTINCRCVLRVSVADRTAALRAFTLDGEESMGETAPATPSPVRTWSTPGGAGQVAACCFDGDGQRVGDVCGSDGDWADGHVADDSVVVVFLDFLGGGAGCGNRVCVGVVEDDTGTVVGGHRHEGGAAYPGAGDPQQVVAAVFGVYHHTGGGVVGVTGGGGEHPGGGELVDDRCGDTPVGAGDDVGGVVGAGDR